MWNVTKIIMDSLFIVQLVFFVFFLCTLIVYDIHYDQWMLMMFSGVLNKDGFSNGSCFLCSSEDA